VRSPTHQLSNGISADKVWRTWARRLSSQDAVSIFDKGGRIMGSLLREMGVSRGGGAHGAWDPGAIVLLVLVTKRESNGGED